MRQSLKYVLFGLIVMFGTSSIEAHPHHDHFSPEIPGQIGFQSGFLHPVFGVDHLLAMVAVGILSAQAGGRTLLMGPTSFLAGVAIGGMLGLAHLGISSIEILVAFSLVAMGLVLTLKTIPRQTILFPTFVFFGFVHGHAHGMEIPSAAHAMTYMIGFLAGSIMLHAAGVSLGLLFKKSRELVWANPVRLSGAAIAAAGLFLIVNAF